MSETTILAVVVGALWGVLVALVGIVWAMLRERIGAVEGKCAALESQNTAQEASLARLQERMLARENAHAEHRENMSEQLARLEHAIQQMSAKIDRLAGHGTPYPPVTRAGGT
jgi:membrane protein required for beta-lactamase induction